MGARPPSEGMASTYGNLGTLARLRGDIPAARNSWTQSRDLYAESGKEHMVEQVQRVLDELPE